MCALTARNRFIHLARTARLCPTFFLILGCLLSPTEPLLAQPSSAQRSLSFDSRYLLHGYSNSAVGRFGVEVINLATVPADLLFRPEARPAKGKKVFLFYDAQQLRNVGNGLLLFIGSTFLSNGYTFAYHEYGHGTRAAAIGYKPYYGHGGISTEADVRAAQSGAVKLYDDFLSFYAASLFNTGGFAVVKPEDTLFPPLTQELREGWDGLLTTGGLNNDMLFTEFIEDELYRRGGHIGFLTPYLSGKLAAQSYETGLSVFNDVANTVTYYQGRGYRIERDHIANASRVSFFTSALSYQFVYQFLRMFSGRSARFKAWELRGVQLPNTLFYMNRTGLSYKIRSGYRTGGWRFPVALEYVFKGEQRTEVSVGAEKQFDRVGTAVETVIGKSLDVALDVRYHPNKWLMLSAGYALYNERTLHGERLIPSLEQGSTYHDLYLRASLTY